MKLIHISDVRRMLAFRKPVNVTYVTGSGEIQTLNNAMPLGAQLTAGTRNFKLPNGQIRRVRDHLIIAINNMEVYL